MSDSSPEIEFSKKGFPTILVFNNYFEIKGIDQTEFKQFGFEKLVDLKYYNPNERKIVSVLKWFSAFPSYWDNRENFQLIIEVSPEASWKDAIWKYKAPNKFDIEFDEFIQKLIEKTKLV